MDKTTSLNLSSKKFSKKVDFWKLFLMEEIKTLILPPRTLAKEEDLLGVKIKERKTKQKKSFQQKRNRR